MVEFWKIGSKWFHLHLTQLTLHFLSEAQSKKKIHFQKKENKQSKDIIIQVQTQVILENQTEISIKSRFAYSYKHQ